MTAAQLWAGVDVGKEAALGVRGRRHRCGGVVAQSWINDEQPIRALIGEIDALGKQVAWTVDLTTVYATLLLTVLADAGKSVRIWRAGRSGRPR